MKISKITNDYGTYCPSYLTYGWIKAVKNRGIAEETVTYKGTGTCDEKKEQNSNSNLIGAAHT
jgi:hypothetical protein